MILRTQRLFLRDFQPSDLPAYRAFREHPEFRRLRNEPDVSPDRSAELLHTFIAWASETPRSRYQLAIEKPVDGLIGSCGVRMTATDSDDASFGCELASKHWGKGYGLEAGRAMIDFAFAELGLHRIYADTLAQNQAALALAQKLGMRVEGRHEDTLTLAIRAPEWNAKG
jgi:[ribosomal protein S5]-alanine N-acetyltransferase